MNPIMKQVFAAAICGAVVCQAATTAWAQPKTEAEVEAVLKEFYEMDQWVGARRERLAAELDKSDRVFYFHGNRWYTIPKEDALRRAAFLFNWVERNPERADAIYGLSQLPSEFWIELAAVTRKYKGNREKALDYMAQEYRNVAQKALQNYDEWLKEIDKEINQLQSKLDEFAAKKQKPAPQPISEELPTEWKEMESSKSGTYRGTWKIDPITGEARATWDNGAKAKLHVTRIGDEITITRDDKDGATKGLKAEYKGKVEGRKVKGTVTWTSASGRVVEGTWEAEW